MTPFIKQLRTFGKVKINELLSKHTTFKIGGPAAFFITITTEQQLLDALSYLDSNDHRYFMLGGGSNMLVSDQGFDGVVIKYQDDSYTVTDSTITVGAGATTVSVANNTIKDGLTGFEWGVGIPGTIGGAVRGNAGATGGEIKDTCVAVTIYRSGEVLTLNNDECEFTYRNSIFKKNGDVILSASFALQKTLDKEGRKKALEVIQYRVKTQPKGFASTGCIFTNVNIDQKNNSAVREVFQKHADLNDQKVQSFLKNDRVPAGWLVEACGLKGREIGGAKVSETHGNFIINTGTAKAQDVINLIDEIKEEVYTLYKIKLHEEIQLIS